MKNRFKRVTLDEIYKILLMMTNEDITLKYQSEVRQIKNGVGFKMYSEKENVTLYFYPNHATSELNIIRNGMRYIYSRRDIRLKKNTLEDLMIKLMQDPRMFGCTKMIELYLIEIIKLSHDDVIESIYLS